MEHCGNCRHIPSPPPVALLQIRRGYRARWNDLLFSVEAESGDWMLRVQDSAGREPLYTAHRCGARAAQLAAAEYAIFRVLGPQSRVSPAKLAGELKWQEHW